MKSSVTWLGSPPGKAAHMGQIWGGREREKGELIQRWGILAVLEGAQTEQTQPKNFLHGAARLHLLLETQPSVMGWEMICCESGNNTHHLCGGFGVFRGDVVLQGRLREAHLSTVRTRERLRLLD